MRRTKKKIQPARTDPLLQCAPYSLLLFFLIIFSVSQPCSAACPTIFYAQAISHIKVAAMDFYYTRTGVPTTADCANYCGVRQFCRTAVYNHDARTCSLSYDKYIECSTTKQRYNTFHLTTDGADSLSMISCVEVCLKSNTLGSSPSSSTSPPHPSKSPYADGNEENTQWRRWSARNSAITASEAPKTLFSGSSKSDTVEKPASSIKDKIAFPPSVIPVRQIIPVNHPNYSLNSELPYPQTGSSSSGSSSLMTSSSGDSFKTIPLFPASRSLVGSHINVDGDPQSSGFLQAIQQLNKIAEKLAEKEREQGKSVENSSVNDTKDDPSDRKVMFKAGPLNIKEVFKGATSADEASRNQKNFSEERKNFNAEISGGQSVIRVFQNGTESKVHSGGFVKWLKPGETLKILSPKVNDNQNGTDVIIQGIPGKVPIQLITVAPELFDQTKKFASETKKTVTAEGQIKVAKAETENGSHSKTQNTEGTQAEQAKDKQNKGQESISRKEEKLEKPKQSSILLKKKNDIPQTELSKGYGPNSHIVVDGHILTQKEASELLNNERTSSTTTTTAAPWKPAGLIGEEVGSSSSSIEQDSGVKKNSNTGPESDKSEKTVSALQDEQGFMNTFFIQGLSSVFEKHNHDNSGIGQGKNLSALNDAIGTTTTTTAVPTTSTSASKTPIVCYRYISQQRLLYAEFRKGRNVTLNQCRCACAETWQNAPQDGSKEKGSPPRCKSLHYNEETRECFLNKADHTGKYDLIFDKKADYHYVSCDIPYLLNTATKMCGNDKKKSSKAKSPRESSKKSDKETSDSNSSSKTTPGSADESSAKKERPALSPKAHGTVLKGDTISSRNAVETDTKEEAKEIKDATTEMPTTQLNKVKDEEYSPKGEDSDLIIAETTTTQSTPTMHKIFKTNFTEPSVMLISSKPVEMAGTSTTSQTEIVTTDTPHPETSTTTTESSTSTTTTTTTTQSEVIKDATINGCFEVIHGYEMNNTAGGLERDVSLNECQCFCANSLSSRRYSFQCSSATYYPKERDCILNLGNRQSTPEVFIPHPSLDNLENRPTYVGLMCSPAKAVEMHVNDNYLNGCVKDLRSDEDNSLTTTTFIQTTTTPAAHTDDCFLELPNHVLEGTALAIETNVTVEECKCYCVDSDHRYGTACQSLQYYFDSQTCLLNKENRITDPDRFNYDSGSNVMHSYFDYRCHVEKVVLSAYIEQVCQTIVQISIKDLLSPAKNDPSLNIDDKSTEASKNGKQNDANKQKEHKPVSDAASLKTTKSHVKTTASTLSRKLRTTTSRPTASTTKSSKTTKKVRPTTAKPTTTKSTTTMSTTSTNIASKSTEEVDDLAKFRPREPTELDDEESKDFKELKFESTAPPRTLESIASSTVSPSSAAQLDKKSLEASTKKPKGKKKKGPKASSIPELEENEEEEEEDASEEIEETQSPINSTLSTMAPTTASKSASTTASTAQITRDSTATSSAPSSEPSTTSTSSTSTVTTTTTPKPTTVTTTMTTTTTTFAYRDVGPCRYSALYQTYFAGKRQITKDPIEVGSPVQCFAACRALGCRSANLIQMDGRKLCVLYKDSIVDSRRTDVLSFDRASVHFDSIQCDDAE